MHFGFYTLVPFVMQSRKWICWNEVAMCSQAELCPPKKVEGCRPILVLWWFIITLLCRTKCITIVYYFPIWLVRGFPCAPSPPMRIERLVSFPLKVSSHYSSLWEMPGAAAQSFVDCSRRNTRLAFFPIPRKGGGGTYFQVTQKEVLSRKKTSWIRYECASIELNDRIKLIVMRVFEREREACAQPSIYSGL